MRINPVSKTNFKSIYMAIGYGSYQRKLKEQCDMYPNKVVYIPISRKNIDLMESKRLKEVIRSYTNVDERPSLVLSGRDFKRYEVHEEGYTDKEDLVRKVNGLLLLPLYSKNTFKEIVEEYC